VQLLWDHRENERIQPDKVNNIKQKQIPKEVCNQFYFINLEHVLQMQPNDFTEADAIKEKILHAARTATWHLKTKDKKPHDIPTRNPNWRWLISSYHWNKKKFNLATMFQMVLFSTSTEKWVKWVTICAHMILKFKASGFLRMTLFISKPWKNVSNFIIKFHFFAWQR
jgi:hypothetical protein